jgi:MFS transporter, DHA3 family, macrolide efflux protein
MTGSPPAAQEARSALGRRLDAFQGMGGFSVIWFGQLVTLLGTEMVKYAFVVHTWAAGGQATSVVGLLLAAFLPQLLLSPMAGVLVDRWPKKTVLLLTDLGGLIAFGALAADYYAGDLRTWHVYLALVLSGAAGSFQYPAFSASIPLLVPREKLQKATGMMSAAQTGTAIGGPALAGVVFALDGLGPVLVADVASFVVALAAILVVAVPDNREPVAERGGIKLWSETAEGIRYVFQTPSIRALTLIFTVMNISIIFGYAVLPAMILARSHNDAAPYAVVSVCVGLGGLLGGVALSSLRTPASRVRVMLLAMAGVGLIDQVGLGAGRSLPSWCVAEFLGSMLLPVASAMLTQMMQTKIPPAMQGRAFGSSLFLSQGAAPITMIAAGPLADHYFEPAARTGSGFVGFLAPLVGRGPGTGMACMLVIAGVITAAISLSGFGFRSLRDIDTLMPDIAEDEDEDEDAAAGTSGDEGADGDAGEAAVPERSASPTRSAAATVGASPGSVSGGGEA